MKILKTLFISIIMATLGACNYLDVVPDNIATIDYAFRNKVGVEKYLSTCYSYLPADGDVHSNPALMGGDEVWMYYPLTYFTDPQCWYIARGFQNANDPLVNYWDGTQKGKALFQGIRDCNIFLDNIDKVNDLDDYEKERWSSEVMFLKAYYHFWLLRMYGPIPLMKENLAISSSPDEVKVYREPVDECINYIVGLIDESVVNLPGIISNEASELGRITKSAALAMKAKILVTAASPLYNGNSDYASLVDGRGKSLFNSTVDKNKWKLAVDACKEAIEECEKSKHSLYVYKDFRPVSDSTRVTMSIRNSVCKKWNTELIWGSVTGVGDEIQRLAQARIDPSRVINESVLSQFAPTLKMAETFYSAKGIPINEDKTWDYNSRYQLKTATADDRYYIKNGYQTVKMHFDREPRFYASLGFDGSTWYGQGRLNDNDPWYVQAKAKQPASRQGTGLYSATGYWAKKLVYFENIIGDGQTYTKENYPFPIIRLADLYLLYAEALNEAKDAPDQEVYQWIDKVRERAGLKGVTESWTNFSNDPGKVSSKEGMRKIIRQERLIELSFEGQRFWDLRRWKEAETYMNMPVQGWNLNGETAEDYYNVRTLFYPQFQKKDYLWPIKQYNLAVNPNLVQNPGW